MEFEIYKVTISKEPVKTEYMLNLLALNEGQARRFCKDHELSTEGIREVYFPVPV